MIVALAVLAGCGNAHETEALAQSGAGAQSATSESSYQPVIVDHRKDEIEFRLRQTLAGVEALIEDYKITGSAGIEALQQRQEQLQRQLRAAQAD